MSVRILNGDCRTVLRSLPDECVNCCVTSPPYFGLRDYGHAGQIGLEQTPDAFVAELVDVFREVRRVLKKDGTLWLNLGDSYAGSGKGGNPGDSPHIKQRTNAGSLGVRDRIQDTPGLKAKDLIGVPWRVAFALRADGWYLRQDIIWSKPNPMPESVTDRCTKAHEYLFLLSKSPRYFYDAQAVAEPVSHATVARLAQNIDGQAGSDRVPGKTNGPMKAVRSQKLAARAVERSGIQTGGTQASTLGYEAADARNRRSVWTVATQPFSEAHFATFPPELIEPCIKAGCPAGGTVLDPFGGAGTTGLVADRLGRNAILIELNADYAAMAERRIRNEQPMFADVTLETAA